MTSTAQQDRRLWSSIYQSTWRDAPFMRQCYWCTGTPSILCWIVNNGRRTVGIQLLTTGHVPFLCCVLFSWRENVTSMSSCKWYCERRTELTGGIKCAAKHEEKNFLIELDTCCGRFSQHDGMEGSLADLQCYMEDQWTNGLLARR
jgi:hypothetical protein